MEEYSSKSQDLSEDLQEKQIISLSSETFAQILQLGIDLNMLYLLEGFKEGTDLTVHTNASKALAWKQTLVRKGYLNTQGAITQEGISLLQSIGSGDTTIVKRRKEKKVQISDSFELWWKAYPGTDSFTYKGKTFKGSRALRVKKDECAMKFAKILTEGEYVEKQLIDALELEKQQKMNTSLSTGQNKMSYFQNTLTYLHQRTFEPFIELLKDEKLLAEIKISEKQTFKIIDI